MKYILTTGGVISGIGKGIISSSIGALLCERNFRIIAIKIDPYLNSDAGTFSPYEHGEVFVLNDGGEVDLDLGNYERFLDCDLNKDCNITTGKIYSNVIRKERNGEYLGKTVQVVPHITNEIQDWIERVANTPFQSGQKAEICLIELGGVVGDIESMPFIEALRQFQFRIGQNNFFVIHVSLVPTISGGEQKTKPTQNSVKELRSLGIFPDMIICRCSISLSISVKDKISMFCHVGQEKVISLPDLLNVHFIPEYLNKQNVIEQILNKFLFDNAKYPKPLISKWHTLALKEKEMKSDIIISVVGKYVNFPDSYHSLIKAIKDAGSFLNYNAIIKFIDAEKIDHLSKLNFPGEYQKSWDKLKETNGIIIPGGFDKRGIEGMILTAQYARENNVPLLGICLGMQVMVIEAARNILNIKDANSEEFDKDSSNKVIIEMPEFNPVAKGASMRLGLRKTLIINPQSLLKRLYKNDLFYERHRHRFEFNQNYTKSFEDNQLIFSGIDETGERMEAFEIPKCTFYLGLQSHPEFLSRPMKPSPPFIGLIKAATYSVID